MKQRNKKVLGFFIATSIAVSLFTGACMKKPDSVEKDAVKKPEVTTPITESENGIYLKKLSELKDIIFKLNQKDTKEFKELTKEAFSVLAELINELPKMSDEVKKEVKEETDEMKKAAEKIVIFEEEEKVVAQVKEAFTATNEAIDEATGAVDEDKEAAKKFLENVEKKFNMIKGKIAKIDKKTYKTMTKELFMDFYSLIRYMHKEMESSDIMVTKKEVKKLTQQAPEQKGVSNLEKRKRIEKSVNSENRSTNSLPTYQDNSEKQISKKDTSKKKNNDKKKAAKKPKSSCGCQTKMKDKAKN